MGYLISNQNKREKTDLKRNSLSEQVWASETACLGYLKRINFCGPAPFWRTFACVIYFA